MSEMTWAEKIVTASEEQQRKMGFGPFLVHLGQLVTLPESLTRSRNPNVEKPVPWPIAPAPGWLTHRLNEDWSLTAWCALGGEWIFRPPVPDKKHVLHVSPTVDPARRDRIVQSSREPLRLIADGEAFAFCDDLFVIPDESFVMNSYRHHVTGREPLDLFLGFRGHTRQYPEIITPGIYRAHNHPNEESERRYKRKVRVASNVVKQAVFERENIVLTMVQARGVLQHYGIIGATDVLDLTYDVNVAKWFALNTWDRASGCYQPKRFIEKEDPDKAYDEYSLVYAVIVRAIGMQVTPEFAQDLANYGRLTFAAGSGGELRENPVTLPPRNLSPLWSTRARRHQVLGYLASDPTIMTVGVAY